MNEETIQNQSVCIHRFSNGESSLVAIGGGRCRCELCNIDIIIEIVDESYKITDEEAVIEEIRKINLDELLEDENEEDL